jgi:glycosyltransferase involved in cell wall biosynthesis
VGEGPLQKDLEAQAARLGIGDKVDFLGFQKDVAGAFASFYITVFPSLWEGTPLTLFESMAMGRPIVSTDADGLRDVLVNEKNALLVRSRDPESLARAIIRVLDDPQLKEGLSQRAISDSNRFDIQRFVDKMSRLYEILVERYRSVRFARPRWDYDRDFTFLEDPIVPVQSQQTAGTSSGEGGASVN